eukprot:m.23495 g.23495  ORF g.23495 m.23495 type:complete len:92 (+) comp7507_c0_seq2:24-299(+)
MVICNHEPTHSNMGGPGMEVFRFGVYVFMPICAFYYFNLPEFYNKNVKPELGRIYPKGLDVPTTLEGNQALLEKLKAERKAKNEMKRQTAE